MVGKASESPLRNGLWSTKEGSHPPKAAGRGHRALGAEGNRAIALTSQACAVSFADMVSFHSYYGLARCIDSSYL